MIIMANPRKFSEKIAIHTQKQAEETAEFEKIMREVIGATRGTQVRNPHHLHINQNVGAFRAGSLPNVNHIGTNHENKTIDLQAALDNLEEIRQGREPTRDRRHGGQNSTHRSPHHPRQHHHHHQTHFQFDPKHVDVSPYSSSYLSPPPDTSWRRTNSDSALHHTAMMANNEEENRFISSLVSSRSPVAALTWDPGKRIQLEQRMHLEHNLLSAPLPSDNDSRPKSCEVPRITIHATHEDHNQASSASSSHQPHLSLLSNTGSLPDLTNLHFPAPLTTPIDIEDLNATTTSTVIQTPYSYSMSNGIGHSPFTYTMSNGIGCQSPVDVEDQNATNSSQFTFSVSNGVRRPSPYDTPSPYSTTADPTSPYSPQSPRSNPALSPSPTIINQNSSNILLQTGQADSGIEDSLLRNHEYTKDISSMGISTSFDTNDLFPSADEALRAGLDTIDFDGLQILTDMADGTNEETSFRLERS